MLSTAFVIQPIGLLLILCSLSTAASAQSAQSVLPPGSASALVPGATVRIRLEGESEPIVGVVMAATADSFLIESGPRREGRVVPVSALTKVEISRGHKSYAVYAVFLGAAAGATIGGLKDPKDRLITDKSDLRMINVVIGGTAGGLVGLFLASAFRTEQWEQVPLAGASPRITIAPHVSALGLSARLTF
jgi:hypothetical protein